MPSIRTPFLRDHRRPPTAEWAWKFKRTCELELTRREYCDRRDEGCDCREHIELSMQLRMHFAIPPWVSVDYRVEAPPGLTERESLSWWQSALEVALTEAKQKAALMTQGVRAVR
jgi:hypothetical protein